MSPQTTLATAALSAAAPALLLVCLIVAGAGPIAAAIAAFGMGFAVRNAFGIWQTCSNSKRPTSGRPPADHDANTL